MKTVQLSRGLCSRGLIFSVKQNLFDEDFSKVTVQSGLKQVNSK